jgi:ribosomal 50S subunit-recycling heat shock protein
LTTIRKSLRIFTTTFYNAISKKKHKMRIDKYLKVSRLIKRRTVANDACDAGRISVNGRQVKASYDVKVGDEIEIAFGGRTVRAKVLSLTESPKRDEAVQMYELL